MHSPALLILQLAAGIAMLAIRVVVHMTTLPVEFDASFGKALPVLVRGRYLGAGDLPAARSVLQGRRLHLCGRRAGDLARHRALVPDFEILKPPR